MVKELPFNCSTNYYYFLNGLKNKIRTQDTQVVGLIIGAVGSGKSCRSQEILYFVNEDSTNINQITFDSEELIQAVLDNHKKCIISDEGKNTIYSLDTTTKNGKLVNALFDQARTKNLLILICIPRITNVAKDILQIADFGIFVWEKITNDDKGKKHLIKGNMALFLRPERFGLPGTDSLQALINYYTLKRKEPSKYLPIPTPALTQKGQEFIEGKQGGFYAVPEEEYKQKKIDILKKFQKKKPLITEEKERKTRVTPNYSTIEKMKSLGIPNPQIARALDISLYPITHLKKKISQIRN